MRTVAIEFTAGELSDMIGAVRGVVALAESEVSPEGVTEDDRKALLFRYRRLLAKLSDFIQQPAAIQ
jgi:exo-beta-1,3-glucanase (GH17 family)